MSGDLSNEAIKAVSLAKKLLALSKDSGATEAEASIAASKAMELLAAHNLDISIMESHGGAKEARGKETRSGGLYKWQRTLWRAIAELNFCLYETVKGTHSGGTFRHELIGRKVNVASCYHLGDYLEKTIERMVRERVNGEARQLFTSSSNSYREGVADSIVSKLNARRFQFLMEQHAREKAARQANPGAGAAMTVMAMSEAEFDANMDIKYGEGYSAKLRAARAAAAARFEEARLLRRKWEIDNPEAFAQEQAELKAAEEKRRKEEEKRAKRRKNTGYSYRSDKVRKNELAYWDGRSDGEEVGLDSQVTRDDTKRLA